MLGLLTAANELGRPFVASRHVPQERIGILRRAFEAALADPALLALAKRGSMAISMVSGREAQEMLTKVFSEPKAISERAKEIIK